MKNWLVVVLFVFLFSSSIFAQAPLEQGSMIIHGGASYSHTSIEDVDESITVLSIMPGLYYFVIPNLAIGGDILYTSISFGDASASQMGIGPGVRYYFNLETAKPFIMAGFEYISQSDDDMDEDVTSTAYIFGGGANFFVAQNVAIEPYLMYAITKNKYGDTELPDINILSIGVGITAFIGN